MARRVGRKAHVNNIINNNNIINTSSSSTEEPATCPPGRGSGMDFSPIHTYSPPEFAPDNTGYTYALSSSYSRAALEYEIRNSLDPVYDSPRMSRRGLRLRGGNGHSAASSLAGDNGAASQTAAVMASQGSAGKTRDGSDSGEIKFAWSSAAVTNAARVRLDGGAAGSPRRSPQRRAAISAGNHPDLLLASSSPLPDLSSSSYTKVETTSASVHSRAGAMDSEVSLANGAVPSATPAAETDSAPPRGARATPTNGYGSSGRHAHEQSSCSSSSSLYSSGNTWAAHSWGERVGGLVETATWAVTWVAQGAARARRAVLRWLLLLLAQLLWSDEAGVSQADSDDSSKAAAFAHDASFARDASFGKIPRAEMTQTTTTTVTTTTKTRRQRRRNRFFPLDADVRTRRRRRQRRRRRRGGRSLHDPEVAGAGVAGPLRAPRAAGRGRGGAGGGGGWAVAASGGGRDERWSSRSLATQRSSSSAHETFHAGVAHYGGYGGYGGGGYGGGGYGSGSVGGSVGGAASLAEFSDGEGCEIEKRSEATSAVASGAAAASSSWTWSSVRRLLTSPGRCVSALFWWLGTGWYQLVTLVSLLNVFLLTRHYRRHLLGLLLLLLLLLLPLLLFYGGWWCWAALGSLLPSAGPTGAVLPVLPPPTHEQKAVLAPSTSVGTPDGGATATDRHPAAPPGASTQHALRIDRLERELLLLRASAADQHESIQEAVRLILDLRAEQRQAAAAAETGGEQGRAAAAAALAAAALAEEHRYRHLDDHIKRLAKALAAQTDEAERQRLRIQLLGRQVSALSADGEAARSRDAGATAGERAEEARRASEEELLAKVDERVGGSLAALLADVRQNRDGIGSLGTRVEQRDSEVTRLLSSIEGSVLEIQKVQIQLQDWKRNGSQDNERWDEGAGRRRLSEALARLEVDVARLESRLEALSGRVTDGIAAATERCCGDAAGATERTVRAGVEASLLALLAGGDGKGEGEAGETRAALLRWLSERFVRHDQLGKAVRDHAADTVVAAGATVTAGIRGGAADGVSEERVQHIVQDALRLYSADRIGQVDYALESAGGSILSTRCTETYETKTAMVSFFGLPIWHLSQSPRVIIQPDVNPGNCWPFRGTYGYVVVQLSATIRPTAFSLEHVPRSLSPTGAVSSAPRDFAVYGLESEDQEEGLMLGRYNYDQDGEAIQTFPVQEEMGDTTFRIVELRVFSNWGHPEYTCLYRFRVHGRLAPH
ncbi:LOW QUALITY PROTEIN: SUN domain-containing protein 1-like [Lethenteron reissneri]|uniref:LOW QUALITY PROTEIN: SUN domain-containing protein 1-like n=1 Tax=Lethenteron reissneri TaxID=7753 RepID=UPI002AB6312A|nr:LOW QUALITY PROTEIN: SUN domain-containing protein 1-like [Lethenteron reissneri]